MKYKLGKGIVNKWKRPTIIVLLFMVGVLTTLALFYGFFLIILFWLLDLMLPMVAAILTVIFLFWIYFSIVNSIDNL